MPFPCGREGLRIKLHQFDNPLVMTEEGVFVSDKWLRLSEILDDMDLELRWIPHKARTHEDSKPYAICKRRPPAVIRFAGELDDPVDILAALWEGRDPDVLRKLEIREKAEEAFRLRQQMDAHEELADETHFLMTNRSPWFVKHKTSNGKIVKLDHNGRRM